MFPVFDVFTLVFVLSCTYLFFRSGVYLLFAAAVEALVIQRLMQFWLAQTGMVSYAFFFGGVIIASAVIVILCVVYFNIIIKYSWLVLMNRIFGLVAGCLFGLMFMSSVMLPVALKAGQSISKAVASSFTVSYMVPWVQELFPAQQAMVVNRINTIMTAPSPSAAPQKPKEERNNPFASNNLKAVADQMQ